MQKAIIGKKIGMTQIFDEAGHVVPVTLIQAGPCTVVQKKTTEKDGYNAIQLGYETVAERKLTKPELGHQKKAGIEELVKLYDQMVEDRSAPVGISHAGSPADALVVATKLRQVGCTGEILTVCHEPVTGAHVGPGMLAVYFYSEIWR